MERTLVMKFRDAQGKPISMSVTDAREDVKSEEAVVLMDAILEKQSVFELKHDLKTKISAEMVEREKKELYKAEATK